MADDAGRLPVVVVGAGLAGLACARRLAASGYPVTVLEASDGPGGRVRTDTVEGFRLDRGFQVLLSAYPEVGAVLDLAALDLQPFEPGAVVRHGGRWSLVADPRRRPASALGGLLAPIGTLADKARVARLGLRSARWPADGPVSGPDTTTRQWLRAAGLSEAIIASTLGPLLAGILLDPTLSASARQAQFVWRSLAAGESAVPANGMGAIPAQLASRLPAGAVEYRTRVESVSAREVSCGSPSAGVARRAAAVVVATEAPAAAALLPGEVTDPGSRPVGCIWYATQGPPAMTGLRGGAAARAIALDGDGRGPVNNLAVMSAVNHHAAPPGQGLVAASVLDAALLEDADDAALDRAARSQMAGWWEGGTAGWRVLRIDRIRHAQPAQPAGTFEHEPRRPVRTSSGVYVCGDHRDNASIQGALVSGRRAAEAVLADITAGR